MRISILSTFYNDKEMLKVMMDSVLKQDYNDIEHVITDGGSTDGSVELVEEYENKYAQCGKKLLWKSEKDRGLYDGDNKAADLSSGDYIIFGSDPYTNESVISQICAAIDKGNLDYVFGGINYLKDGCIIRQWSGKKGNWHLGWMAANPTLCVRRELWFKYGPYDMTYKSAADYKFQVRLFQDRKLKSGSLPVPLVNYFAGGASNGGIKANLISIKENFRIMRECKVKFGWFTVFCKTSIAFFAYTFSSHKIINTEEIK